MDVIVFHRLRPDFFEGTTTPSLEDVGLHVVGECNLRINRFPKAVDGARALVAITDGLADNDVTLVKKLAVENDKHFIPLPRKHADWGNRVRPYLTKEEEMAMHKAVSDKNLKTFLTEFMTCCERGLSLEEMLPVLGRFWDYGELRNVDQLRSYVHRLRAHERCPEFFNRWWAQTDPSLPAAGKVTLRLPPPPKSQKNGTNGAVGFKPKLGDIFPEELLEGDAKTEGSAATKTEVKLPQEPAPAQEEKGEPTEPTLEEQVVHLNEYLEMSEEDNKKLRHNIMLLETDLKQLQGEKGGLINELQAARKFASELQVQVNTLNGEVKSKDLRIQALESAVSQNNVELRKAQMNKESHGLRELLESFRTAWKLKAMSPEQILTVLMEWKSQ